MYLYILIASVPALAEFARRLTGTSSARQELALYSFALFLTLFIGLRYEVGADWQQYHEFYNIAKAGRLTGVLQASDPAFMLLCWVSARFNAGVTPVFTLCAAVTVFSVARFSTTTPAPWVVFTVAASHLLLVMSMDHVRQSTAIGFVLLAIIALERSHLYKYLALVALATLFHRTAVIFFPLAAVSRSAGRLSTVALILAVSAAAYYALLADSVDLYTRRYVESGYVSAGANLRVVTTLIPAVIFLTIGQRFCTDISTQRFWNALSTLSLALVISLIVWPSSAAIDRLSKYCIPLSLFVYGFLPSVGGTYGLLVTAVIVTAHIGYLLIWLSLSNLAEMFWIPYQAIFTY